MGEITAVYYEGVSFTPSFFLRFTLVKQKSAQKF